MAGNPHPDFSFAIEQRRGKTVLCGQHQRQWTGPKPADQFFRGWRNFGHDLRQHLPVRDDDRYGIVGVATFDQDDALHGIFAERIRAQAVESLGGENDHSAALESLKRGGETLSAFVFHSGAFCLCPGRRRSSLA